MSSDVADFVHLLQESAEVEWYRFVETTNQAGLHQVPLVVWRYCESLEPTVLNSIGSCVEDTKRLVKWYFDKPGRNWVLTPERVMEIQRERKLSTDVEAINALTAEEPDYCSLAVADFNAIVSEVRRLS